MIATLDVTLEGTLEVTLDVMLGSQTAVVPVPVVLPLLGQSVQ